MSNKYKIQSVIMLVLFLGLYAPAYAASTGTITNMAPIISYLLSGSSNSDVKTIAIEKIKAYASDQSNPQPTVQDYIDAGVTGVTLENLYDINGYIAGKTPEEVDTTAKIQAAVNIVLSVAITLEEINITVQVKGQSGAVQTTGSTDVLNEAFIYPQHGNVEYFKIGNELPAFQYTSTDCFTGRDSFVYKSGDEYGRVNITLIKPVLTPTPDLYKTLYNTDVINGEPLIPNNPQVIISRYPEHGEASLVNPSGEYVLYNYDPVDDFNGTDYFEYRVTEIIDECNYASIGRVTFNVENEPVPPHVFAWNDGTHGEELWISDGTIANTRMLKDINPENGEGSYPSVTYSDNAVVHGTIYFSATSQGYNYELWKTDGTTAGTQQVLDLAPEEGHGSWPRNISKMGNNIYFMALTGNTSDSNNFDGNTGLWKTNGDINNSTLIENFGEFSGTGYSAPGYLHAIGNGKLIFQKDYDSGNGPNWNPWVSDGIHSATRLKGNTFEGVFAGGFMHGVLFQNYYYAQATDIEHGSELWRTDGTDAGTVLVKDIVLGKDQYNRGRGSMPADFTVVGNKLFFTALDATDENDDIVYDKSLWVSDGTTNGTTRVKDATGTPPQYGIRNRFSDLTTLNGNLYFVYRNVDDNNYTIGNGTLWKSNGTEVGTTLIKDINVSTDTMVATDDTLYFWANDNALWKSDGTQAGTVEVKVFTDGYAYNFKTSQGLVYFELENYNNMTKEYWRSDGTEAGTIKLLEVSYGEEPQ